MPSRFAACSIRTTLLWPVSPIFWTVAAFSPSPSSPGTLAQPTRGTASATRAESAANRRVLRRMGWSPRRSRGARGRAEGSESVRLETGVRGDVGLPGIVLVVAVGVVDRDHLVLVRRRAEQ